MKGMIVNTSVDDIRCNLALMNPRLSFEIKDTLVMLNTNLDYEVKGKNRTSVLKMLKAKINVIKKLKPGRNV